MTGIIRLEVSSETYLAYRSTPWDDRVFGFPCFEITLLNGLDEKELLELMCKFNEELRKKNAGFVYSRVDANSSVLKKVMYQSGFYYAESSYELSNRKIQKNFKFDHLIRKGPQLVPADPSHYDAIGSILADDFKFGRIHEDPWVDKNLASVRYKNWLPDLLRQKHEVFVYLLNDLVIGLHIQRRNGTSADLVLTGVKRTHALLGVSLWASVIALLRDQAVTEVHTLISAANLPIVNLYRYFEFNFDKFVCGFHKRY